MTSEQPPIGPRGPHGPRNVRAEIISLAERVRAAAEQQRATPPRINKPPKAPEPPPVQAAKETMESVGILTARQELFCEHIAKGALKGEAATLAGFKGKTPQHNSITASRLLSMQAIKLRIAELQSESLLTVRVTRDIHMQALGELRQRANQLGQIGAAIRAEELRGKLVGLYRDEEEKRLVVGERVAKLPVDEQLALVRAALLRIQSLTGAHIQMKIEHVVAAPQPPIEPAPIRFEENHDFDGIDEASVGFNVRRTDGDEID